MKDVLENSDIVSLHCPLTEDTKYLINKDSLKYMKKDSILINTGRGGLINTKDLIEAIINRKIGGVGLDVYENERDWFFSDHSN